MIALAKQGNEGPRPPAHDTSWTIELLLYALAAIALVALLRGMR